MPYKKTIIVLFVLLVLVTSVLVAYNFLFKEPPPEPNGINGNGITPDDSPWTTDIEPSPEAKINAISQEPVIGPVIDSLRVKYYSTINGNVWQSNFDGTGLMQISSVELQNLEKVLWSFDKTKVISIFDKDGQIKKYFYDYTTDQSIDLNESIQWISWAPLENKVVYQFYDPDTKINKISIANPDDSDRQYIFNTRIKNLIVEWPSEDQISIRTRPSGLAESIVYTLNPSTKALKEVLGDRYGLSALWSPQGNKILFSETDEQGKNLKLKVADKDGQTVRKLDVVTLPEKCVWSQDERIVFCAVPRVISNEVVLPDDYYKGVFSGTDDFWSINIETKEKTLLVETYQTKEDFDAYQLFLDDGESYLFFVNKKDGLLYSLRF